LARRFLTNALGRNLYLIQPKYLLFFASVSVKYLEMSHSIKPMTLLDRLAFALRRWSRTHRFLRFFRRVALVALRDGSWEFARILCKDFQNWGPPGRTFSLYHSLRWGDPSVRGQIILEDQVAPRVPPDSLVVRCGLDHHLEQPWPIVWTVHKRARLVSNSLALLNEKKELCLESVYGAGRWRDDPGSRFLRLPKPVSLHGSWTSIISNWVPTDGTPVYGHWLHDALPRLAILSNLSDDTQILVPHKLKPIYWETLDLLGLRDRCRPTHESHLLLDEYHFSAPTSMICCYNPYGLNWVRNAYLPKVPKCFSGPKKFFFARTVKNRAIENMDEISSLLASHGWEVINDMDLTFAETVKLFSDATDICGFQGSNMSNVMFCSPHCRVLQWSPDIWLDGFVDVIASVVGFNYRSVVLHAGGPQAHRPRVSPKEVLAGLKSAGY